MFFLSKGDSSVSFKLINLITELLFPRCCPVCGDIVLPKGELICPECFRKLSFVRQPACKKCGKEILDAQQEYCYDCSRHKRSFDYGLALLNYDDTSRISMVKIKYKNKREYLDFYAEAIWQRYYRQLMRIRPDVLIPVPVHPSRKRRRGFNQAEVLAELLGEKMNVPVVNDALLRSRKTAPQKQLGPAERLKNLSEAFVPGRRLTGVKRALLVDDIYTTGSTIEACTRILKESGVQDIFFVTICIGRGKG